MTNDYSPERLADRAQIQDVMYRWCRAIDRLTWTQYAACSIPTPSTITGRSSAGSMR